MGARDDKTHEQSAVMDRSGSATFSAAQPVPTFSGRRNGRDVVDQAVWVRADTDLRLTTHSGSAAVDAPWRYQTAGTR